MRAYSSPFPLLRLATARWFPGAPDLAGGELAAKDSPETLLKLLQFGVIAASDWFERNGARPADEVDEAAHRWRTLLIGCGLTEDGLSSLLT